MNEIMIEEKRFAFGKNWSKFLETINEERIKEAEQSLREMLHLDSLKEKSFLDIGSGSGLFSLAAARLGAEKIFSFDYDSHSVDCTRELRQRFFPDHKNWTIEKGSVLDKQYLNHVGVYDVVYSWGVLHHTGAMWQALENTIPLVKEGGYLFIAIYNDQGIISKVWTEIKKIYNKLPVFTRPFYVVLIWSPFELLMMAKQVVTGHVPWQHWIDYKKKRGMSILHDIVDWIGGYPFEVASPEKIFRFYRDGAFQLKELKTKNGMGCNEFVFMKKF